MKREIKFRAWNEGKMVDLLAITPLALDANMNTQLALKGMSGLFLPFGGGVELMQFTGLKDKNGKEIYEGDIVRYYVSAPWDDEVPLEVRAEVIFDDPFYGCFCVKSREGHMDATGCLYEYIGGIEVIGNIYEHNHLLR